MRLSWTRPSARRGRRCPSTLQDVTVLGELDDIITISDFVVTPYVGAIPGGYDFKPNIEVAEVVEVPLEAILNGRNLRDDTRLVNGIGSNDGRPMHTTGT